MRIIRKAFHRSDARKTGTDIVKAGKHGGEICLEAERFDAERKKDRKQANDIQNEIIRHTDGRFFVERFALELYGAHGAGMDQAVKFASDGFKQDHDARDF